MTKPRLSPWFPADVKPVHVGVYISDDECDPLPGIEYRHWNGEFWGLFGRTPGAAQENKDQPTGILRIIWRGLAEKPG